jgi:hypothetical protein
VLLTLYGWGNAVETEVSRRRAVCGGDGSGEVWTEASAYIGLGGGW